MAGSWYSCFLNGTTLTKHEPWLLPDQFPLCSFTSKALCYWIEHSQLYTDDDDDDDDDDYEYDDDDDDTIIA